MKTSKPSRENRSALESATTNAAEDAQMSGSRLQRVPSSDTDTETVSWSGRKRQDKSYSQPGSFHAHESLEMIETRTRTIQNEMRIDAPAVYVPVPSTPSCLEEGAMSERGEFLTGATLVSKHNILLGEIMQPVEEPFWRQRKVQHCLFLLFLVTLGVAVSARVAAGGDGGSNDGSVTIPEANSEPPIFECSNDTNVGCRYIGEVSLDFQDPTTFLVAFCEEADFVIPTSDSCDCKVNILNSASGSPEICQSCSFLDSASGWAFAYDCSNIIEGECVGRDTAGDCISSSRRCFETTLELRDAVDEYLVDNSAGSRVASIYGFPIGSWCVSNIQDFSYLFSLDDDRDKTRHPIHAAADFNEDISRWDVSNATTMRSMFSGYYHDSSFTHFNKSLQD
jgi:hypothetical protein